MKRRMLGAAAIALALGLTGCNSDEESNSDDNSSANSAENNENSNANSENSGSLGQEWSVTIDGLDESIPLPEGGLQGTTAVAVASLKKIQASDDSDPPHLLVIEGESGMFDTTGEKTVAVNVQWNDDQYRCESNLDTPMERVGGTLDISSLGPVVATFEADVDCFEFIPGEIPDPTFEATVSGNVTAVGG